MLLYEIVSRLIETLDFDNKKFDDNIRIPLSLV